MTPPVKNSATTLPDEASGFSLKRLNSYSVKLEGGLGGRDLENGQGIDHRGAFVRVAAGLRFKPGRSLSRHSITPRIFFEHQSLKKDLGQGVVSTAQNKAVGLELDYGFALHPQWFSLHAVLGIGGSFYSSPEAGNGLTGTEFAKNALLFPLQAKGFRIDVGAQLCTWRDAFCLGVGYALDSGINPKLEVVDGNYPPFGLSPAGYKVGIGVDAIRIVQNLRKSKPAAVATPAPKILAAPALAPKPAPQPAAAAVQPPPAPRIRGGETAPPLKGKALFQDGEKRSAAAEQEAKRLAENVRARRILVELEFKKAKPDLAAVRREIRDMIPFYRKALKLSQDLDAALLALRKSGRDLKPGEREFRESVRHLQKAKTHADGVYFHAFAAHGYTAEAVKEHNAKAPKSQAIDFPVTIPVKRTGFVPPRAAKRPPAAKAPAVKPKAAPRPATVTVPAPARKQTVIDFGP